MPVNYPLRIQFSVSCVKPIMDAMCPGLARYTISGAISFRYSYFPFGIFLVEFAAMDAGLNKLLNIVNEFLYYIGCNPLKSFPIRNEIHTFESMITLYDLFVLFISVFPY